MRFIGPKRGENTLQAKDTAFQWMWKKTEFQVLVLGKSSHLSCYFSTGNKANFKLQEVCQLNSA